MTENLLAGETWPNFASASGADIAPSAAVRPDGLDSQILRISPRVVMIFGSGTSVPAVLQGRAWFRVTYRLGSEPALEISKAGAARGTAAITCLVHEDWIGAFSAALNGESEELQLGAFHLPSDLLAIAAKAYQSELTGVALAAYRTAKGLELLCETAQLALHGKLIALHQGSGLSAADMQRLFAARRTIAEQFEKKLTLDSISRACGLNRAKLTRGFKTVFGTSIAEALSEERLRRASMLLQTTNRPVSNIGYEAGYLNNASFARAFARRFGVCPSEFRLRQFSLAA